MTDAPHLTLVSDEKPPRRKGRRPKPPRPHEGAINALREEMFDRLKKARDLNEEAKALGMAISFLAHVR